MYSQLVTFLQSVPLLRFPLLGTRSVHSQGKHPEGSQEVLPCSSCRQETHWDFEAISKRKGFSSCFLSLGMPQEMVQG